MAIARTTAELSRWSDLTFIRRAIASRMPELDGRRHALAHTGLDWNDIRDDMLMICCEWDLETKTSIPNPMRAWTAWFDSCRAILIAILCKLKHWKITQQVFHQGNGNGKDQQQHR